MIEYLTLDDISVESKIVGLRIDINSPVIDNKVVLNERIRQSCESIVELSKKNAKVVLLAHQGREGKSDFVSLKQHAKLLSKESGIKIKFIDEIYSSKVEKEILNLKNGEVLLLENVRFSKDEEGINKKNNIFNSLENLFEYYIFDAFSVSHRDQSSVTGFKKIPVVAGRLMEKELKGLSEIDHFRDGRIFLFGGAKPDDLIELMKSALDKNTVDEILLSGVIGEVALHIKGYYLGKKLDFLKEHEYLGCIDDLKKLINKYDEKIILPKDLAVIDKKGKRSEILVEDLENNKKLLDKELIQDIGLKTVDYYSIFFKHSHSVYIKGPAGNFELKGAEIGTKGLMTEAIKSKTFVYMGGGHSVTSAEKFKLLNKFSYVSLAGGALVKFLSGKKLVGVECLERSYLKFEKQNNDVVVVGSNVVDLCVKVEKNLSEINLGDKIKINEDFKKTLGGGGVNVSIAMSRLQGKIAYLGKLAYETKDEVSKVLEKNNVALIDTKISKKPGAKSILIDTADNDRVILTYRGQNAFLELNDFKVEDLNTNNFYFTSLTGESFTTLIKLAKKIKKNKCVKICYNPSLYLIESNKKEVLNLISIIDVVVLNLEEAQVLTGLKSLDECANKLISLGLEKVVITCGSIGAYGIEKNKKMIFQKALSTKVVDTTGAGDSFGATLFYFLIRNYSLKDSMKMAALNSASVVAHKGAIEGLMYLDDLKKK